MPHPFPLPIDTPLCVVCLHALIDIEPGQLVSMPPSDLPMHVATLHLENGFGADEEYDVS